MVSPYEKCPVYENTNYLLRLIESGDASDLLSVYSDEKAVPLFNSDNCNGNFYFTSLEQMQTAIEFWQREYHGRGFVRWTIVDQNINHAIGTIELFNRKSEDYYHNCGILRLDLRSDYEHAEAIFDILSLIVQPAFELFECQKMATKVPPFASERRTAVEKLGFTKSEERLIGHDQKVYTNYYVLQK